MALADLWLAIGGLSPVSLAAAVAVVLGIILISLGGDEGQRLEQRARSIYHGTNSLPGKGSSPLRHPLRWLVANSRVEKLRQKVLDWIYDHSANRRQAQLRLRQAGLRNPRASVYYDSSRLLCALCLGVLTFEAMSRTGYLSSSFMLAIVVVVLAVVVGLYIPELWVRHRIRQRQTAFAAYWDDAIGLLIICLDAGLSIEVALRRIARELALTSPVLAEELIITVTDLSLLGERRLAYLNLASRIDLPSVKAVTIALIQAERQGASISNALRVIASTNRQARVTRAEEKAASLGPKMTVPMIVFFLPVIFVIIIAPIVMTADF